MLEKRNHPKFRKKLQNLQKKRKRNQRKRKSPLNKLSKNQKKNHSNPDMSQFKCSINTRHQENQLNRKEVSSLQINHKILFSQTFIRIYSQLILTQLITINMNLCYERNQYNFQIIRLQLKHHFPLVEK